MHLSKQRIRNLIGKRGISLTGDCGMGWQSFLCASTEAAVSGVDILSLSLRLLENLINLSTLPEMYQFRFVKLWL